MQEAYILVSDGEDELIFPTSSFLILNRFNGLEIIAIMDS